MSWEEDWRAFQRQVLSGNPLVGAKVFWGNPPEEDEVKVKVNVAKLRASLEAKLKEVQAETDKQKKAWEDSVKKATKELLDFLTEKIAEIKAGKFDPTYGPRLERPYGAQWPQKPYRSDKQEHMEQLLRKLALVEGETLDIDDRSDYFNYV